MNLVGTFAVPVIVALILLTGFIRKVPVFEIFLSGAGEGVTTLLSILPTLVGMITAVEMFEASGALDLITQALTPFSNAIALPVESLPLGILRPISGGGSIALLDNILKTAGPNSAAGRVASVLCGSSETTFYTITVYFGSIKISKTRHAVFCALLADLVAIFASTFAVNLLF